MTDATFTFRVDEELKAAFSDVAKAQERTSAQLLRTLMREEVEQAKAKRDYDEWFEAEIEDALREADSPDAEWVDHEVVRQDWARQRAELVRRLEAEEARQSAAE